MPKMTCTKLEDFSPITNLYWLNEFHRLLSFIANPIISVEQHTLHTFNRKLPSLCFFWHYLTYAIDKFQSSIFASQEYLAKELNPFEYQITLNSTITGMK